MKFTGCQLQWTDYLNAQLLHLKPNKFIRVLYYVTFFIMAVGMLWGLYFLYLSISGEYLAGVGSILAIFIFPVIFLIIFPLYRYVLLPNRVKKIFSQQKELQSPFEIEFTDTNIILSNEFGNTIRPWKNFIKWKENELILTLYHSDIMFTMLPKRLFTNPQQLEMVKSFIEKNGIRMA